MYVVYLINNWRYLPKGVPGDLIDTHFEDKEVDYVGILEEITQDNKLFRIFCIKEPDYVKNIITSWMVLDEL